MVQHEWQDETRQLAIAPRLWLWWTLATTIFNIGHAIELTNFSISEVQPLAVGLERIASNPIAVLQAVLDWTGGQPFLTQKVFQLIQKASEPIPAGGEAQWVETLVQKQAINNWETSDDPEHLRTIRDRLCRCRSGDRILNSLKLGT